jgi:hypothetical protein
MRGPLSRYGAHNGPGTYFTKLRPWFPDGIRTRTKFWIPKIATTSGDDENNCIAGYHLVQRSCGPAPSLTRCTTAFSLRCIAFLDLRSFCFLSRSSFLNDGLRFILYNDRLAMRYGVQKQTNCVGWHLPMDLIQEILDVSRQQGIRPGRLVTRILARELPKESQPIPTAELNQRIENLHLPHSPPARPH